MPSRRRRTSAPTENNPPTRPHRDSRDRSRRQPTRGGHPAHHARSGPRSLAGYRDARRDRQRRRRRASHQPRQADSATSTSSCPATRCSSPPTTGTFIYLVTGTQIVEPDALWIIDPYRHQDRHAVRLPPARVDRASASSSTSFCRAEPHSRHPLPASAAPRAPRADRCAGTSGRPLVALSMPPWGFWPLAIVGIVLFEISARHRPDASPARCSPASCSAPAGCTSAWPGWCNSPLPGYLDRRRGVRRRSTWSPHSSRPSGRGASSVARPPMRSRKRCASRSRSAAFRWRRSGCRRSADRSSASSASAG